MLRVLTCLGTEHDPKLVLLAVAVCVLGSWIAIRLWLRARAAELFMLRLQWSLLAGIAGGAAVWTTHFVAMLGYAPGVTTGFDPAGTAASGFVGIGMLIVGFVVASLKNRFLPEIGGALIGAGIVGMHYTGMEAFKAEGSILWDPTYVAASIIMAVAFGALATHLSIRGTSLMRYAGVAALVFAIAALHFTAMAALSIVPDVFTILPQQTTSHTTIAIAVCGVSFLVIGPAFTTYLMDRRRNHEAQRAQLASERRIHYLAHFDALTGLPNRAAFRDRLNDALASHPDCAAVICIDLDRFKEINDVFGHGVGDRALIAVTKLFAAALQPGEYLARFGGDEFFAVQVGCPQPKGAMEFAERLHAALAAPILIEGHRIAIGASFGIAVYPQDGANSVELMRNADFTMYRAKTMLGKKMCFFEPDMDVKVRDRRALGLDLRQALSEGQLSLHYQAQTRISTSEILGYEALLRWHHPTRGNISPVDFIPIAEETGLIVPIGEWVLREACATAAKWPRPYRIAVNISPVQIAHTDLPTILRDILFETGLAPSRLELEITETTLINDMTRTLHVLRQIKAMGVAIAMDDFGTGYSSLSTLQAFPFDKIKIDRSFVDRLPDNAQAVSIMRAILALGRSLNIPVLAEGIETAEHLRFLREEGCDEGQGFLLGRPNVPEKIPQLTGGVEEARRGVA
ncbi:MAG: diguanylate cyclase [Methylobacteriaceae bacterium]|jgi:diguanylate cyclase (GGDEF)-like protein|nr:diguanylate cyclase [Methylobacteriaceae bacterium]